MLGLLLVLTTLALAPAVAQAAQDDQSAPRRAYKPAERREQAQADAAAEAAPAANREQANDDTVVPAGVTDPEAYKRDLKAARDQRDRDLKDAEKETDRRKFEKRKEQIFTQYAAILAEMREKYVANQGDKSAATKQQPKGTKKSGTGRPSVPERYSRPDTKRKSPRRDEEVSVPDEAPPARGTAKSAKRKSGPDDGDTLADAQKRLDDENKRHEAEMEQLNKQLAAAQSSNNRREVRKVERAIEKENNTFETKKSLLERRVRELGGTAGGAKDTTKRQVR